MKSLIMETLRKAKLGGDTPIGTSFANAIHIFEGYRQFQDTVKKTPIHELNLLIGKESQRNSHSAIADFKLAVENTYNDLLNVTKNANSEDVRLAISAFKNKYKKEIEDLSL